MRIRSRILLVFFALVLLGVIAVGSYSLVVVRDHLLGTSRDDLDRQARYLATLIISQPNEAYYPAIMQEYSRYTGHTVELLDTNFNVRLSGGVFADSLAHTFSGIAPIPGSTTEERQYVRITASEGEIRSTVTKVGYIIFGGIFGVLLLTLAFSWVVADRITDPIRQLAAATRRIAGGDVVALPKSERKDEVGDLTRAVSAMAGRLQEDIQDLKRLNRAQEDFIAGLSHEVRNPIFSARGYLEMALDECASETREGADVVKLREYLEKSHRNLLRIHNLFADMLTLVKLEFDQEPVELSRVRLDMLIHELEETFFPQAQDKGVVLEVKVEHDTVRGNAEILKIALSNLLSNAIQHTRAGEVRLAITRLDSKVKLEVSDTGAGIPAEQLGSIFEKFYRMDKSRSREQGGAGLGLALVQQCMRTLNTEIEVSSKVGEGSRFWFHLPAAQP
ncbi:sensor histidine kinase [Candidatus Neomarinimicrobiota bacterium]